MLKRIGNELWISVRIILLIAVVTGIGYPLLVTGAAQVAFNSQANGSLVTNSRGQVIGSSLIGQCFYATTTDSQGNVTYVTTKDDQGDTIFAIDQRYFQSRPSFTVDANGNPLPCNAANSAGSNLAPSSTVLVRRVRGYTDYLRSQGIAMNSNGTEAPMPVDLVTGDFTGFDPDVSVAGALAQVNMVARARGLSVTRLTQLVMAQVQGSDLGIWGAPVVNVLSLNDALDAGAAG